MVVPPPTSPGRRQVSYERTALKESFTVGGQAHLTSSQKIGRSDPVKKGKCIRGEGQVTEKKTGKLMVQPPCEKKEQTQGKACPQYIFCKPDEERHCKGKRTVSPPVRAQEQATSGLRVLPKQHGLNNNLTVALHSPVALSKAVKYISPSPTFTSVKTFHEACYTPRPSPPSPSPPADTLSFLNPSITVTCACYLVPSICTHLRVPLKRTPKDLLELSDHLKGFLLNERMLALKKERGVNLLDKPRIVDVAKEVNMGLVLCQKGVAWEELVHVSQVKDGTRFYITSPHHPQGGKVQLPRVVDSMQMKSYVRRKGYDVERFDDVETGAPVVHSTPLISPRLLQEIEALDIEPTQSPRHSTKTLPTQLTLSELLCHSEDLALETLRVQRKIDRLNARVTRGKTTPESQQARRISLLNYLDKLAQSTVEVRSHIASC